MRSVGRWLGSQYRRDAKHLLWVQLDSQPHAQPLRANDDYVRITLSQLFLARSRDRFKKRFPAVRTSVSLRFAGTTPATFSKVTRTSDDVHSSSVLRNFELMPLLPYRGGTVELDAALYALEVGADLGVAVKVLSDVGSLIGPPVAQALALAEKVATNAQTLFAENGNRVELRLHETFSATGEGEPVLRPGHWAVVNADERELDRDSLRVMDNALQVADGGRTRPLEGYDYMLLRIDGGPVRSDWELPQFRELRAKALMARARGEDEAYRGYRNALLADVLTSSDLTHADQNRAAKALKAKLDDDPAQGFGMSDDGLDDLEEIVTVWGPSLNEVRGEAVPTLEQLLSED